MLWCSYNADLYQECKLLTSSEMEAVLGTKLLLQKSIEDAELALTTLIQGVAMCITM